MILLNKNWQLIDTYNWYPISGSSNLIKFELYAKIADYDVSENRTPIYTRLVQVPNVSGYAGSGYEFTCSYAPTVQGSGVWTFNNRTITETEDGSTQYVYHESDGSKQETLTATLYNGYLGLNATIEETVELPTIPRASTIEATATEIGEISNIYINSKSSSFRHTVQYSFQGLQGTVVDIDGTTIEKSSKTKINWRIPTSFYNALTNDPSATCYLVCTTYSNNNSVGVKNTSIRISVNEYENKPQLSIETIDTGGTTSNSGVSTVNLTGNNKKIIIGFSKVKSTYTITPKNGATIKTRTINGASLSNNSGSTTPTVATSSKYVLYAKDSRKFENETYDRNLIQVNYKTLSITPNFYRPQPTTGEVALNFEGTYWAGNFGTQNNTIEIGYKYKASEETELSWDDIELITINPEDYEIDASNNKIYTNSEISLGDTFDYEKSYEFRLYYKDKLVNTFSYSKVPKGRPVFWWDDRKLYDGEGNIYVNFNEVYPTGSVYISNVNENPTTKFGGTWTLLKKEFKPEYFYSSTLSEIQKYLVPTSNMSINNFGFVRDGNKVYFRVDFVVNTSIADSAIQLGTLNLAELGINSSLYIAPYDKAIGSDAGDCIGVLDINASGVMTLQDTIIKGGATSQASGVRFRAEQTFELPQYKLIDSFCNCFYWQRTA